MTDRIRFHLDENVDPAVADGLRRRGADVTTAYDAGLLHAPDEQQLEFARAEGRMLVTHDEDFLSLAKQGIAHGGIAYCHPESRSYWANDRGPAVDSRLPDAPRNAKPH